MKRLEYILLLFGILTIMSCENKNEEKNATGSIYGCVTDFATGNPVQNANVQLRPTGETTLTGSDGMYEFLDLKDGDYSITITKAEYGELIDDYVIQIKNGQRMRRDVQIEKAQTPALVTNSIYGSVYDDATSDPIQGALLTLQPGGQNCQTDSEGAFCFENLDPLQYTITAQATGYRTDRKMVMINPDNSFEITFRLRIID